MWRPDRLDARKPRRGSRRLRAGERRHRRDEKKSIVQDRCFWDLSDSFSSLKRKEEGRPRCSRPYYGRDSRESQARPFVRLVVPRATSPDEGATSQAMQAMHCCFCFRCSARLGLRPRRSRPDGVSCEGHRLERFRDGEAARRRSPENERKWRSRAGIVQPGPRLSY